MGKVGLNQEVPFLPMLLTFERADCGWISLFGDGTVFGVGINGVMLNPACS